MITDTLLSLCYIYFKRSNYDSIRFNQIMEYFKIGWIAQYQNKGDRFEIILYRNVVYGKIDSCYDRVDLNYISKVHIGVHS